MEGFKFVFYGKGVMKKLRMVSGVARAFPGGRDD